MAIHNKIPVLLLTLAVIGCKDGGSSPTTPTTTTTSAPAGPSTAIITLTSWMPAMWQVVRET